MARVGLAVTDSRFLMLSRGAKSVRAGAVWTGTEGECAITSERAMLVGAYLRGGTGTAGTFGLVQSANPGRQIQFGLKLLF